MSDNLVSLMREATAPLHVEWEDPVSLRRLAGRRRRRRHATVALVSLTVLGAGGSVALTPAAQPPTIDPPPTATPSCVHVMIPQPAYRSRVRVFHSSLAVATAVAEELRRRGYDVEGAARTDESTGTASAVIRYGPYNGAYVNFLRAHLIPDDVIIERDEANEGTTDLILGVRFRQLAPACVGAGEVLPR